MFRFPPLRARKNPLLVQCLVSNSTPASAQNPYEKSTGIEVDPCPRQNWTPAIRSFILKGDRRDTSDVTMPRPARYLRFKLRDLLLAMAAACILLAWMAAQRNHAGAVRRALNAAQRHGASLRLEAADDSAWAKVRELLAGGPIPRHIGLHWQQMDPASESWGPYGPDGSGVPIHKWDAEHIRQLKPVLAQLTELQDLSFWKSPLPDGTLYEILPASERLRYLSLEGTLVGSGDLRALARVPNLTNLDLSLTNVADDDLRQVARMARLKTLRLEDTRVTDAGLRHLASLRNLESVDLGLTRVTPEIVPLLIDWQVSQRLLVPAEWPEETLGTLQAGLPAGCDIRKTAYEFRHRPGSLALRAPSD
jgi:hypothetical protein